MAPLVAVKDVTEEVSDTVLALVSAAAVSEETDEDESADVSVLAEEVLQPARAATHTALSSIFIVLSVFMYPPWVCFPNVYSLTCLCEQKENTF